MAEEKRLTVGELRAALVGVPDEQEVSFLSDEDDTVIGLEELMFDDGGSYFSLSVTSPLLDLMREMENELLETGRIVRWIREETAACEQRLAAVLKQVEDCHDRISRGFSD